MKKFAVFLVMAVMMMIGGVAGAEVTDSNTWYYGDTFEDNDLSEYSGDTGGWTTSTQSAYLGSYGVENTDGGWGSGIYRNDVTVETGQTISGYMNNNGYNFAQQVLFGLSHDSQGTDALMFQMNPDTDEIAIRSRIDGTDYSLTAKSLSSNIPANGWVRYEIHWNEDGSVTAELYDESSASFLGEVSDNPSYSGDLQKSGGMGYRSGGYVYYDGNPAISEHYAKNGGMESGDTSNYPNATNIGVVSGTAYSGDQSYMVDFGDSSSGASGYPNIMNAGQVNLGKLQEGESYRVSYYAKSTANSSIYTPYDYCGWAGQNIQPNSGWTKYTGVLGANGGLAEGCADAGNGALQVWDEPQSTTGKIWIDQISIYKINDTEDPSYNYWSEGWTQNGGAQIFDGTPFVGWDYPDGESFTGSQGAFFWDNATDHSSDSWTVTGQWKKEKTAGTNTADGFKVLTGPGEVRYDYFSNEVHIEEGDGTTHTKSVAVDNTGSYEDFRVSVNKRENLVTVGYKDQQLWEKEINSVDDWIPEGFAGYNGFYGAEISVKDVQIYDRSADIYDIQLTGEGETVNGVTVTNDPNYNATATFYDPEGIDETEIDYGSISPSVSWSGQNEITWTWDDVGYEGNVGFRVHSVSGTSHDEFITVNIDTDAPTENNPPHGPSSGETVDGSSLVPFQGNFSDSDTGVAEARLYIDGSLANSWDFAEVKNNVEPYYSTTLSSGSHSYYWEVDDYGDNTLTTNTTTFKVNRPPSIDSHTTTEQPDGNVINDGDNLVVRDTDDIQVDASFSDDLGLSQGTLIVKDQQGNNEYQENIGLSGTSDSATFTWNDPPADNYTVVVIADDSDGRSTSNTYETFEWDVDTTDPMFNLTYDLRNDDTVEVGVETDETDISQIEFDFDGNTITDTSAPFNATFSPGDGFYNNVPDATISDLNVNLTATATDDAGNTYNSRTDGSQPELLTADNGLYYSSDPFVVDNTPPNVSIDVEQNRRQDYLTVDMNNSDSTGLVYWEVKVNGEQAGWICSLDANGDGTSDPDVFRTTPSGDQCDATTFPDSDFGISDEESDATFGGIRTSLLNDGQNDIKVIAYDNNFNTDSDTQTASYDNTAPVLESFNAEDLDGEPFRLSDTIQFNATVDEEIDPTDGGIKYGMEIGDFSIISIGTSRDSSLKMEKIGPKKWQFEASPEELYGDSKGGIDCSQDGTCLLLDEIDSGEVKVSLQMRDNYFNRRRTQSLRTGIIFDNNVNFRDWRATSDLDANNFNLYFTSNDDFTKMDTEIYYREEDPEFSLTEDPNDNFADDGKVKVNESIIIENTANYTQAFFLPTEVDDDEGGWLVDASGFERVVVNSGNTYQFRVAGDTYAPLLGGILSDGADISVLEDDIYADIIANKIDISDWTKEKIGENDNNQNIYRYKAEDVAVQGVGTYEIGLNLTDDQSNRDFFVREGKVRPQTNSGKLYQYSVNSFGLADWQTGLLLIAIVEVIGIAIFRNFNSLVKLWLPVAPFLVMWVGYLPFSIHTLVMVVGGLWIARKISTLLGGWGG